MGKVSRNMLLELSVLLSVVFCVFTQESEVKYNINEEQDTLTYVGNVAKDSLLYGNVSIEEFQRMKFQILTQGNQYAPMFEIEEQASTLRTAVVLDREDICPDLIICLLSFNVAVYIKDKNTDVLDLYKIIKISITLNDLNDNSPEFLHKAVTISISENSPVNAEYFTSGAIDLDTGANNSVQSYLMDPPNEMFGLKVLKNDDGTSDLNIVVKYPLDRESRSFYQLVIYAKDGGFPVRTGSVRINITITDQNDNPPTFSELEYNVTIEENTPINSTIVVITATDYDAGNNGLVTYRFSSRTSSKITEVFAINSTTGEITSKSELNYEVTKKWTFKVEAHDSGVQQRLSVVNVTVNIIDTNDNYPQININLPPGGTKISEAADTGSFVAHVAVFDLDAGVNGQIKCSVHGDHFHLEDFKIDNNYKVVLNSPLNHEITESYEVIIHCQDGGSPPKTNTTSFTVTVEDINDNFPKFSSTEYGLTVQEEIFQSFIIQVSATDADSGENGRITYGLHSNAIERFTVNSKTGEITTNSKFDREVDPVIKFHVMAWDHGDTPLTSTATVIINVTDINDNAPIFPSNPVNVYFWESADSQTINLNVTDPDFGLNGQFILQFPPENDYLSEYFNFDAATGEIQIRKAIDREEIPYFRFWVKAHDRGLPQMSSSAEVIIHIKDINDNIPAITYPNNSNNTRQISISTPTGFVIATVQASDRDEGVNAQLLYFIDSGDTRSLFMMDVNTGRISTTREMEGKDADTYNLEIAVRDNGEIQRTSWAKLKIVIEPANATVTDIIQEENEQNILMVVVFVAITVVLSIVIIVTIFIIRHVDRRNKSAAAPKVNENQYYDAPKVDESMSGSSNMSKDSDTELLKKRAKKEVSFSIDEDSMDLTNVTSFSSTIKPSYLSMDYKPEDSQSTTWLCNNSMSTDLSKSDMYSDKEFSTLSHHDRQLWLQPVPEEQSKRMMMKAAAADDTRSTTSHDTTTSDSGRGGSEEDIHSNRGQTLSDSEDAKHYNYHHDNRHRTQPLSGKPLPRRPPPPIPVDSYQRNISFSDDSVTANTTVASYKHSQASPSLQYKTPYKQQQELFTISGRDARDMYLDSQMTTPGMPYSICDIEEMSEIGTTCHDDASTTTSGSYTINPEDLCNEIDELFFKDVIV